MASAAPMPIDIKYVITTATERVETKRNERNWRKITLKKRRSDDSEGAEENRERRRGRGRKKKKKHTLAHPVDVSRGVGFAVKLES